MISLPMPRLRRGGIPVEDGNRFIRYIRYWRPVEVRSDDAAGFRHPFEIVARYDLGDKQWEIQHSGDSMVDHRDVEAPPQKWDYVPRETRFRFGDKAPGGLVTPWLSEEPWLPVDEFRAVGTDAAAFAKGEEIPEPIRALGVVDGDVLDTSDNAITIQQGGSPTERAKRRLARVADVVLNVERERAALDTDGKTIFVKLDPPRRKLPWITIQPTRYEPVAETGSISEQIAAGVGDTGLDRLLIARVYLVSPPGQAPGSTPDETWSAHVDQRLFWNPVHGTNRDLNTFEPLDLNLAPAIAGGVAQGLLDTFLEDIEQNDAAASAFLSKAQVVGRFWTV